LGAGKCSQSDFRMRGGGMWKARTPVDCPLRVLSGETHGYSLKQGVTKVERQEVGSRITQCK
jgi:hypothetical protein